MRRARLLVVVLVLLAAIGPAAAEDGHTHTWGPPSHIPIDAYQHEVIRRCTVHGCTATDSWTESHAFDSCSGWTDQGERHSRRCSCVCGYASIESEPHMWGPPGYSPLDDEFHRVSTPCTKCDATSSSDEPHAFGPWGDWQITPIEHTRSRFCSSCAHEMSDAAPHDHQWDSAGLQYLCAVCGHLHEDYSDIAQDLMGDLEDPGGAVPEAEDELDASADAFDEEYGGGGSYGDVQADAELAEEVDQTEELAAEAQEVFEEAPDVDPLIEQIDAESDEISHGEIGETDPVLLQSGQLLIDEEEVAATYFATEITVERRYRSGAEEGGVFGTAWQSNLDARIVLGHDPGVHERIAELEQLLAAIRAEHAALIGARDAATGRLDGLQPLLDDYRTATDLLAATAGDLLLEAQRIQNPVIVALASPYVSTAAAADLRVASLELARAGAGAAVTDLLSAIDANLAAQAQVTGYLTELSLEAALNARVIEHNRPARLPGDEAVLAATGLGTVNVVDRSGVVHRYRHPAGGEALLDSLVDELTPGGGGIPAGAPVTELVAERPASPRLWITADGHFLLRERDRRLLYFSGVGLLAGWADRHGNAVAVRRDPEGAMQAIEDGAGRSWEFGVESGRLRAITAPDASVTRYGYEAGRLAWVQDPLGAVTRYAYTDGLVTEVTAPDLCVHQYEYRWIEGRPFVSATVNPLGGRETIEYDLHTRTTTHTNPAGVVQVFSYNERSQITSAVTAPDSVEPAEERFEYDEEGNRTAAIDPEGNRTEFEYDEDGYLLLRRDPDGRTQRYVYDAEHRLQHSTDRGGYTTTYLRSGETISEVRHPDGTSERYRYGAHGEMLEHTDETGATTRYAYDEAGNLTDTWSPGGAHIERSYDPLGRRVSHTNACDLTITYEHRRDGLVSEASDSTGRSMSFVYDAAGRPTQIRDWDGSLTTYEYDLMGRITAERDAIGAITVFAYRADGKVIERTDGGIATTTFAYDDHGRLASVTGPDPRAVVRYQYDRAGRRIAVLDADGGLWQTEYNSLGRVAAEIDPTGARTSYEYAALAKPTSTTDPRGHTTRYEYDSRGRLTAERYADGTLAAREYNLRGQLAATIDEVGARRSFSYSPDGYLVLLGEPDGTTIEYEYDHCGRQTAIIDQLRRRSTIAYDATGNPIRETDPAGNTTAYQYDEGGRLLLRTDALGGEQRYTYDERGRLVEAIDEVGARWRYSYDGLDRVIRIIDPLGRVRERHYDAAGRLISEVAPGDLTTAFEYSPAGRLEERRDPGGAHSLWSYDGAGRVAVATDPLGATERYTYDAAGNLTEVHRRGGPVRRYGYDERGRLTVYTDALGRQTRYDYRSDGLISAELGPESNIAYRYDALGRITEATYDRSQTSAYEYDSAGNLTRTSEGESTIELAYGDGNELTRVWQVEERIEQRFTYDALHRRTSAEVGYPDGTTDTRSFAYDAAGRLTQIDSAAGRATFAYDLLGRETERVLPNGLVTRREYAEIGAVELLTHHLREGHSEELLAAEGYLYDEDGRRQFAISNVGLLTEYEYDLAGRVIGARYPFDSEYPQSQRETIGRFIDPRELPPPPDRPPIGDPIADGGEPYLTLANRTVSERSELDSLLARMGVFSKRSDPHQPMWSESFEYDPRGNRTRWANGWGAVSFSYDVEDQLLVAAQASYTYDDAGRLRAIDSPSMQASYAYSPRGQLVRADSTIPTGRGGQSERSAVYGYDAFGRRSTELLEQSGGDHPASAQMRGTVFLGMGYAGAAIVPFEIEGGQLLAKPPVEASARAFSHRVQTPSTVALATSPRPLYRNAEHIVATANEELGCYGSAGERWYASDALRHRRLVLDQDHVPTAAIDYDVYGNPAGDLTDQTSLGYNGQAMNAVDGSYAYAFRDYDPTTGRFTTPDPLRTGPNWYSYVDPVNTIDLLGLEAERAVLDTTVGRIAAAAAASMGYQPPAYDEEPAEVEEGLPLPVSQEDWDRAELIGHTRHDLDPLLGYHVFQDVDDPDARCLDVCVGENVNIVSPGGRVEHVEMAGDAAPSGNSVRVSFVQDGTTYHYALSHLDEVFVSSGEAVPKGTVIGTMGSSGTNVEAIHLHIEVLVEQPGGSLQRVQPYNTITGAR